MRDLPDGTVTLVFTDIAGSTKLLSELGPKYADVLAGHRRVIRDSITRHDGVEVDTQGDSFFISFRRATDAVDAAREIVSALAGSRVSVRIGMHTGAPSVSENDYVGMDVHVAARIGAAGHGGQVLLSRQTRELVADAVVRDLGFHRLKDVGAVRLYQLGESDFPPLTSTGHTNLTTETHPTIGRQRDLDALRELVDAGVRLVTVTGPGGIGKTTVARALASSLVDAFPDGVWFVDLSAIQDPRLVEVQAMSALGTSSSVAEHVGSKRMVLVIDNFEHVLDAADQIVAWVDACPRLVVVVTSREGLRLSAEHEHPLAPLADEPAEELFRARARALVPGFEAQSAEVRELCRRLDGIPLALELAAARVKLLTPAQLLERLDRRFAFLTGGHRDAPARQRTLEATVAWSHDLLAPDEQELFARLAVFHGGWTLEAAEQVCDADLDVLQSLVAKSLVHATAGRFGMLETIRSYAEARLSERESAALWHRRHVQFFEQLAVGAEPELTGAKQEEWLRWLGADRDNLRAAMRWCLRDSACHMDGLRIGAALVFLWFIQGRPGEGWQWLEQLLATGAPHDSPERLRAMWGAGLFLAEMGDERAKGVLDDTLAMAERLGDASMIARSIEVLGLVAFFASDFPSARARLERAAALGREAGDEWCVLDALGTVASFYPLMGELDRARTVGTEALAIATRRGDPQGARMALFALALTARRRGDLIEARVAGREGLEVCRRLGDAFFASYFLWIIAAAELMAGETSRAREAADEAVELARETGVPLLVACALEGRAAVARADGDLAAALAGLDEAERIGRAGGVPGSYLAEVLRARGSLAALVGEPDRARRQLTESLELSRTVGDTWAEQRALDDLAALGR